jgi:predicted membrane-bound spermidine synthase
LLGGWQFPVASRVYFAHGEDEGAGAGALYAWDLVGACAGALLIGAWLVPIYGFLKTAALIAMVNLPPALLACWWARRPVPLPAE